MAEVVLHCASGRVIGSLAIASRTRGAQRPEDRKLLLRLGGESHFEMSAPQPAPLWQLLQQLMSASQFSRDGATCCVVKATLLALTSV